jgi:hypothetical protein
LTSLYDYYIILIVRNEIKMTVTTNEQGQQNMFAKEPEMYYQNTSYEVKEKYNGRWAMVGIISGFHFLCYHW